MRAYLPDYEMKAPKDLREALTALNSAPGVWRPFAGGTDLMVLFEAGKLLHKKFLSIWHLNELKGIEVTDSHVTLGALVTHSEIATHPVLRAEFPMLCQAAKETGAIAIQNRGTIGGNIANASPAADSPPALVCYEAELELVSIAGSRWLPYSTFHTGYKTTLMKPDELISKVRLPRQMKGFTQHYRKVGTRKAQAISKICFAGVLKLGSSGQVAEVRIALGSVAPTVRRCQLTEGAIRGKRLDSGVLALAKTQLLREISPIDDIRSTSSYRARVTVNLLEEFLERCGTGSVN